MDQSELDLLVEIEELGGKIFSKPWLYLSAEDRILYRHNNNEKNLAELNGEPVRSITVEELKNKIVKEKGQLVWDKLLQRESERRAADIWEAQSGSEWLN